MDRTVDSPEYLELALLDAWLRPVINGAPLMAVEAVDILERERAVERRVLSVCIFSNLSFVSVR